VTIAISIKINDGVVLASDSATTILGQQQAGGQLVALNVYNNANKVFNLRKDLPIGAITWGAGSIGQASISTAIKDLRQLFTETGSKWTIDPDEYTVEQIARQLKEFVFDGLYQKEYANFQFPKPSLGFIVAGYSAKESMADEFQIDIQNGVCTGPRRLRKREESGTTWAGEPEALNRLILGRSGMFHSLLQQRLGIQAAQMNDAMLAVQQQIQIPFVLAAMPLQDAIDLGKFMVDVTKKFSRFKPGAPTVGGPIEIAAISKHEGFRWVSRKYYFERALNPPMDRRDRYAPKEDEHGKKNATEGGDDNE